VKLAYRNAKFLQLCFSNALQLCFSNALSMINTFSQHSDFYKYIWQAYNISWNNGY